MKINLKQPWISSSSWLRILITILLVLGVFFRFVNLDRKVYWHDEAFTSLRISGYTASELVQQVFDGHQIGVKDLQKYQRPNTEKTFIDLVNGLAIEEPQLPPLYFLLARFWVQWFGSSVAVTRSLSALISLLAFLCTYWLCQELFDLPLVGWVAIALVAVSPFHVLYAQEARPYSLWTVTILLSSAALLRAMRVKTKLSWGIYAATLSLGLYTYLFSGLVAIGHGIYVVATESFRLSKIVVAYLLASLAGFITFVPWLGIVISNVSRVDNTTRGNTYKLPLWSLIDFWTRNLSYVFFDVKSSYVMDLQSLRNNIITYFFLPLILILVGYSIYFLYRNAPKRVCFFILTITAITALFLMLPDLILGGRRSVSPRYLVPCYLGVQLAVAYLLSTQITSLNIKKQELWQIVLLALFSGGVISCAISSQADTWWNKYVNYYTPQVASIINQSPHPLLISDSSIGNVLSLSYLLDPKVQLQLMVQPTIPKINKSYSDVFFFNPFNFSKPLRSELQKEYKIELVHKRGKLWRLEK
jgi:uncharacterized membrane protein